MTTNGGLNWTAQPEFIPNGFNTACFIDSNSAIIAGYGGTILKYSNNVIGISNYSSEIPSEYKLSQNYPNPFNPVTTIEFSLPKNGFVNLRVYDITGREVWNFGNAQISNAGSYKVTFDASKLSSGVYFYSLCVDNKIVDTKKMILLK